MWVSACGGVLVIRVYVLFHLCIYKYKYIYIVYVFLFLSVLVSGLLLLSDKSIAARNNNNNARNNNNNNNIYGHCQLLSLHSVDDE